MNGQTVTYAYIPLPGGATMYKPNDTTHRYWHEDWLESTRVESTLSSVVQGGYAFAPYSEVYNTYGTVTNEVNFTGDTQDIVSGSPGLFDTPNRELSQPQGRWLSPDPAGAGWNQYAYATNPNSETDPSGLCPPGYCYMGGNAYWNYHLAGDLYGGGCLSIDGGGACAGLIGNQFDLLNVPFAGPYNRYGDGGCSDCTPAFFALMAGGATNNGGFANWLAQKAKGFCSAYPDVTQVGAGADFGFLATGGAQVTLNANGNSGQVSLSWAWNINAGFAGPDAYVLGGVVRNAPTNASLEGLSFGGNLAVGKTGISGNSNNIQATLGPSALPATVSGTMSANLNVVTIPYAGYFMNQVKGACTALFGAHR